MEATPSMTVMFTRLRRSSTPYQNQKFTCLTTHSSGNRGLGIVVGGRDARPDLN